MEKIEMVEKLREKADVSLEEARDVLERCGWNLLDAMILLEQEGKTKSAGARASSVHETPACVEAAYDESKSSSKSKTGESVWSRLWAFLKKLFRKGMENRFIVSRDDSVILNLPVLVAAILMISLFWLTVVFIVIGFFAHCRYSFSGADLGKDSINDGLRKASDAAQNFVDEIKSK